MPHINYNSKSKVLASIDSRRLFFAGAREHQMPKILTMIQVQRITPVPAVLCIVCIILKNVSPFLSSVYYR